MIYIAAITFTAWLLTLTVGQNLVLIGGNLRDDNTPVWEKMAKLAVSKFYSIPSMCLFLMFELV